MNGGMFGKRSRPRARHQSDWLEPNAIRWRCFVAAQQKRKQSGISAGWVLQLKKTWHLDDCLTTQGEGTYIRPWSYVEWLGEEINRSRFHSSDAGWQDDRNFMYAPDIFKFGEKGQVQLSCHSTPNYKELSFNVIDTIPQVQDPILSLPFAAQV